ncbi:hypothetical protein LSH36_236g04044 [Paralvinella palmiformis]|uniref:Peptidase S1 domain-containing protein n=1 Tax=Paralvinella palmiformis TaxID=53620 RepID=A0AAD9JLU6_9ANNE|nr:hypothetical protein LSH36_236g04044 [Paralvinella palmiformis]
MKIFLLASLLAVTSGADECGKSKYDDAGEGCPIGTPCSNVVGGMPSRENEFPFQASLRTSSHFCGAVLANTRWVVTAAHCVVGDQPGDFTVVLGAHFRQDTIPSEVEYNVVTITVHPDYDSSVHSSDIALLELETPVLVNENIRPVCAPDPDDVYEGTTAEISGWGTLSSGGLSPNQLYYTTVVTTTNAYCQLEYNEETISDDMICASDTDTHNERDTCQGDSGGPMATKVDGQYHVIGLTSWGYGCASGWPGVYNRIGYFADWVTSIIAAGPK